jgi:hypothetical protein
MSNNNSFDKIKAYNKLLNESSSIVDFVVKLDETNYLEPECNLMINKLHSGNIKEICEKIRDSEKHQFLMKKLWHKYRLKSPIVKNLGIYKDTSLMETVLINDDPSIIENMFRCHKYTDKKIDLLLQIYHYSTMPDEYYRAIAMGIDYNRRISCTKYIKKPIKINAFRFKEYEYISEGYLDFIMKYHDEKSIKQNFNKICMYFMKEDDYLLMKKFIIHCIDSKINDVHYDHGLLNFTNNPKIIKLLIGYQGLKGFVINDLVKKTVFATFD